MLHIFTKEDFLLHQQLFVCKLFVLMIIKEMCQTGIVFIWLNWVLLLHLLLNKLLDNPKSLLVKKFALPPSWHCFKNKEFNFYILFYVTLFKLYLRLNWIIFWNYNYFNEFYLLLITITLLTIF